MRVKSALLLCAVGLFSLVGCSQPPKTSTSSSPEPSPVTSAPTSSSTLTQGDYPQLSDVVSKTKTAVEANDFTKAKQEFDQFEAAWSQVEDGIKEKSTESYDAIEQDMDQVNTALKSAKSDQAISALETMNNHIQSIPKS